jgi:hypothetical protein
MMRKNIILKIVSGIALGIVFLPVAGFFGLHLLLNSMAVVEAMKVPELTVERAQKLLLEVGGIDAVTREARVLIARCESESGEINYVPLYPDDLKDTPAISLLFSKAENYSGTSYTGTSLAYLREGEGGSHLELKFGNHFSLRRVHIFDTNATNPPQQWVQLTPNIFFEN